MVLIIVLVFKSQRRRVSSLILPRLGFKIESGMMKSEVRMSPLFQSTLRPWGLNLSLMIFKFPATSLGCSAMMSKLLSVSTRRPGDVPAAAVIRQYRRWRFWDLVGPLTAHVCNKKSPSSGSAWLPWYPVNNLPVRLCADLVSYCWEHGAIAFLETRSIGIRHIKVESSILGGLRNETIHQDHYLVPGSSEEKAIHLQQASFHLAKNPSDEGCSHL